MDTPLLFLCKTGFGPGILWHKMSLYENLVDLKSESTLGAAPSYACGALKPYYRKSKVLFEHERL